LEKIGPEAFEDDITGDSTTVIWVGSMDKLDRN
jgi:hypothetical protein